MAELDILNLTCVKKQDSNAKDEVSLYLDGTKVFGPQKMSPGDRIPIPLANQSFTGLIGVELLEEDPPSGGNLQLGAFTVPDSLATLPGSVDHFGVFDNQLPDAFYYVEYHVLP